jgi:hypothetical protein
MLEQPSRASANRTANSIESSTVQLIQRVQVKNMGRRLFWIGFSLVCSACFMAIGLRCGCSTRTISSQAASLYVIDGNRFNRVAAGHPSWLEEDSVDIGTRGCRQWTVADSSPLPLPYPSQIGVGLIDVIPTGPGHARFSRGWAEVIPDWRRFSGSCGSDHPILVALSLHAQPTTAPWPPAFTQFHPSPPNVTQELAEG